MLRRTDLRSRPLPPTAALRALLPRAEVDVDAVVERVRPIVDGRPRARGRGRARALRAVRPGAARVRPGAAAGAGRRTATRWTPRSRTALETSIERARRVHADQRRTDVVTQVVPGGVVSERFVPVRRVGLYAPGGLAVYPSSVVMNVVPAQEAGVESLVVVSPAAGRARRPAAPHDPRRRRAAGRRGGVGGRRGAGRRAARVRRHGHRRAGAGAGRHGHRAGQRLPHRGQAAAARPDRDRRRGRAHGDRRARRRDGGPGARRRGPGVAGRARPVGRLGAGDRPATRWPTPSTPSWSGRSRPPSTPSASAPR